MNDYNGNRLNVNGNNFDDNRNGHAFGIALASKTSNKMKTYKNLYAKIYDMNNLTLAWKKARKGKTKKPYVIEFEENLAYNIKCLHDELKNQTYIHEPLTHFPIKDPKTRKISKSEFRDRLVHHAIVNILEPIFDPTFINDSCANRKCKGNLFAIKRFKKFMRKVSRNGKLNGWINNNQIKGYYVRADIKHYFQSINHKILLSVIRRKIVDERVIWLIEKILAPRERERLGHSISIRKECP